MKKMYALIVENRLSIQTFLIVGALTAIINLGTFLIAWLQFGMNYNLAVTLAYLFSVGFHFSANRRYTFKSHHEHVHQQLPKYITMILINYSLTLIVMRIIVIDFHLSPLIGNLTAIGITVGISYMMSRFWIFSGMKAVK